MKDKKILWRTQLPAESGETCWISAKNDLFHQRKWSITTNLNTTHNVFVKQPCAGQQIGLFGPQLKIFYFVRDSYQEAISEPHCQVMLNLDQKPLIYSVFVLKLLNLVQPVFLQHLFDRKDKRNITDLWTRISAHTPKRAHQSEKFCRMRVQYNQRPYVVCCSAFVTCRDRNQRLRQSKRCPRDKTNN